MPSYRATNKQTGEVVGYDAAEPQVEHLGDGWRLELMITHAPHPDDPPPEVDTRLFAGRRGVTRLELVALVGDANFAAIIEAAKTSAQVAALLKMIDYADAVGSSDGYPIHLDDPRLIAGMQALEALAVVSQGTAERVNHG